MNAIATHEKRLSKMTLKAAVIYDDFDFAARAAALLERVAIRADEAMKWDIKPWRLDVLQEPSWRCRSRRDRRRGLDRGCPAQDSFAPR